MTILKQFGLVSHFFESSKHPEAPLQVGFVAQHTDSVTHIPVITRSKPQVQSNFESLRLYSECVVSSVLNLECLMHTNPAGSALIGMASHFRHKCYVHGFVESIFKSGQRRRKLRDLQGFRKKSRNIVAGLQTSLHNSFKFWCPLQLNDIEWSLSIATCN